jgi:hypothetical protein
MQLSEKIQSGIASKEAGNIAFRNNQLVEALRYYHESILYLNGLSSTMPSMMNGLAQHTTPLTGQQIR